MVRLYAWVGKLSCAHRRRRGFLQQIVQFLIHADFIIFARHPVLYRHALGIDMRDCPFAHDDLMKDAGCYGHHAAEQPYRLSGPDGWQFDAVFSERDLLLELLERWPTNENAADVVTNQEFIEIASDVLVLHRLQAEDVEWRALAGDELARTLAA